MAGGNGGFTIRTRGFDKEEVNEYISNLRKRMNEMEANLKANDKKTEEAVKAASTADERVEAAKKAGEERAAELTKKLTIEQHAAETLRRQIDDLKAKLDAERRKFSEMLKSGNGVSSEAKKAYSEIIAKGEADAKEIVDKAKEQADEIMSAAQAKREQAEKDLSDFLKLFGEELDGMNRSYGNLINGASVLFGTSVSLPVQEFRPSVPEKPVAREVQKPQPIPQIITKAAAKPEPEPEPVPEAPEKPVFEAPAKPAPENTLDNVPDAPEKLAFEAPAEPVFETSAKPVPEEPAKPEPKEQNDDEIPDFLKDDFVFSPVMPKNEPEDKTEKQEFPDFPQFPEFPEPAAESKNSAAKDEEISDGGKTSENSVFEDWGGNDFASDIFSGDGKGTEESSSDDEMDLFSSDMFANLGSDGDDDMTSDLSGGFGGEDITVTPLDMKQEEKVSFDSSFTSELIGQTMPSSMLGDDVDDNVRETLRSADEKFAVKPSDERVTDMSSIDLDALDLSDSIQPEKHEDEGEMADFDSDESELQKALREAEEALNSLGGTNVSADSAPEPEEKEESTEAGFANPWEDLQKQLEELDRSGGAVPENDEPEKEPTAPSADDSSIWNFGDTAGSGDDDMSSDVFSGFGGL